MKLRIPYWPGRAVTFGGRPNPMAMSTTLHRSGHPVAHDTKRVASGPGWAVLLVRYDWKEDR